MPCRAGTYSNRTGAANASVCTACSAGMYSTASGASATETCRQCDAGMYSTPGASVCKLCAAELTGPEGGPCTPCVKGTWRTVGTTACVACSANETTVLEASTSENACVCKPGFGLASDSRCVQCPAGKFKSKFRRRQIPSVSIVQITAQALRGGEHYRL